MVNVIKIAHGPRSPRYSPESKSMPNYPGYTKLDKSGWPLFERGITFGPNIEHKENQFIFLSMLRRLKDPTVREEQYAREIGERFLATFDQDPTAANFTLITNKNHSSPRSTMGPTYLEEVVELANNVSQIKKLMAEQL